MVKGIGSGTPSEIQEGGPVKQRAKQRGIFEKVAGSDVWWVVYFDQFGKKAP
jgi:hypothetical protein